MPPNFKITFKSYYKGFNNKCMTNFQKEGSMKAE